MFLIYCVAQRRLFAHRLFCLSALFRIQLIIRICVLLFHHVYRVLQKLRKIKAKTYEIQQTDYILKKAVHLYRYNKFVFLPVDSQVFKYDAAKLFINAMVRAYALVNDD